jgi:hypothetical protein
MQIALTKSERIELLDSLDLAVSGEVEKGRVDFLRICLSENPRWGTASCIFIDRENHTFLFLMPGMVRESDAHLYFIFAARVIEVLRLDTFSSTYSFQQFPSDLENRRAQIQESFVVAVTSSGDCLGWLEGPWETLSPESKALCHPHFSVDNDRPAEI